MKNLSYLRYFFTYMWDPDFPWYEKVFIGLGILYIIIPTDLIPEFVFPIGFIDDSVVLTWLVFFLMRTLKNHYQKTVSLRKNQLDAKQKIAQNNKLNMNDDW